MKIAHYVSCGIGGADRCALNLVRALKRANVDLTLFYGYESIPRRIDTHPPDYTPPSRLAQFEEVGKMNYVEKLEDITAHGIDILHTHRSGSDVKLIPGLQEAGPLPFKILETNFHGELRTRADRRIMVSKALADKCPGYTEVIPNAISQPMTTGNKRKELGLEGKFVFGRLARPDDDLFCAVALEAYAMMQTENTAFLYVGPSRKTKEAASKLKIKNIVYVDSTIDDIDVSKLYLTMDVHCHSNKIGETFGNTIAESMIHGIPTISHPGFMDSWPQAHEAHFEDTPKLYVKDKNPNRYAFFMHLFMTDPNSYLWMARAQKFRANKLYDADIVAAQYIEVYKDILK